VEGLRKALEEYAPDLELGIAAPGPVVHRPVSVGNATYFHIPLPPPRGRLTGGLARWRNTVVPKGAVSSCIEVARAYSPDVVHVHGSEHFYGLAIPDMVAPTIISLQGIATMYERFSYAGLTVSEVLTRVPTRSFARGLGPIHGHRSLRSRAAMEGRILASCDDFMGRTEWDKTVLRVLRPSARYYEVGEVLGEPFYQARWSEPEADERTLFCTGGASALKGVEVLLESLILLRGAGVRGPRLRLAGNVTDGLLAPKIQGLLAARELRGAVDVLGGCPPSRIAEELARATAFVLPSHIDNSPNTLCEAMLVGAPCIAAFVGGVPSLVRNGVDGLLYHDADPYALAGKIDQLLADRTLAAHLGANARKSALRRHDLARVAGQAVAAYRAVLSRRHGREVGHGRGATVRSTMAGEKLR
jgi:glycosyltransferase involved in cell wall biosynthesis